MVQTFVRPQHARIAFGRQIDLRTYSTSRSDLESATVVLRQAVSGLRQHWSQA
jgi:hypothetical protein